MENDREDGRTFAPDDIGWLDFETKSAEDIKAGTYRYMSEADAIICAFALGDGPPRYVPVKTFGALLCWDDMPVDFRRFHERVIAGTAIWCAWNAGFDKPVTLLELELQAEVDKYLCAAFLLSLQNEGAVSSRLKDLLFREYRIADGVDGERAERYRAASHLAYRYCGYLERDFLRRARLADLARESRRFYRLGQREKLEKIAELQ